jgi:capsular polysaccharide biosynthesis protein
MSIYYQYVLFNTADVVIAQHGGGLSNIVFMRRDAAVIEFSPPWGRESNHFLNLAGFMGVGYTRLLQSADHGPVNIDEAVRAVDTILKSR